VQDGSKAGHIILEVSSFQLETIETFHPETALLLNITEDHLDRYEGYGEYIAAKQRIFENQTDADYAVVRRGVPLPPNMRARQLPFSAREALAEGAFLEGGTMRVRAGVVESRYERALSPLVGVHNTENLLAALLVAHIYHIDRAVVEDVLRRFRGLPHRVEPVRDFRGIRFINDSKATNVDATKRALESMDSKVVLIAGGKDKGGSYAVIQGLMERVRGMVLFGEAKEKINEELRGTTEIRMEKDLAGAVEQALALAQAGDTVLFSPMCSSFDQFRDYKERGNAFKRIVESL
jgi:UDP-N-acetylmuramoylalanine--D-glutamate ligase